MNQRLIWNFEINPQPPLDLNALATSEEDKIKWEARFFWPENTIIVLTGLPANCLDLTKYQIKKREDQYLLLPGCDYNIKRRRGQLLYKPQLQCTDNIRGYGKKINLNEDGLGQLLIENQRLSILTNEITVCKIALIHEFPTEPTIKLELARLEVAQKIFFSACIEGRSQNLVEQISKHLLGNEVSCDYVSFLQKIQTS
ncbi:Uncharacterised protein [Legionella lansingensis]|uniref:Uncharacterized protein n=1 Tax=Legionella lansingensis TaxID=45067 RepID=A0A0W0VM84_9GAMM|nr:hypothetical protein [Legionella lansingensis]KTD21005.1 hypothetical protein Llan_1735 [Legionella lansingensis]SNV44931.1 Uncharacterised protein [Legionella lansingensis]